MHARAIPSGLCSGALLCKRSSTDSTPIYAASSKKQIPTMRSVRRSFSSRRDASGSTDIRQSRAAPEVTSIKLSKPKPVSEILLAIAPSVSANKPSTAFHATVRYSRFRPLRTIRARLANPSIGLSISLEQRCGFSSEGGRGPAFADYDFTETLHFFELRAELKQHQVNASGL